MLTKNRLSILYFIKLIKWDAIAIFCYAVVIGMSEHFPFFRSISIPIGLSALVGTLLSLLLAFRTAQSYERWWEARIVWGSIVNDSRTLIRQLALFIPEHADKSIHLKQFARRQSIWCYTLANTLRKQELPDQVKDYLREYNINGQNLPNLILEQHSKHLQTIADAFSMNANQLVQLDTTIQRLTESLGRCERIKNTIFPRSYSVLIHFLIYVLMTILPFGLEHNNPWVEIFVATLVPVLFISIEQTAILMQDPFENKPTDTPMTTISQTIERNLFEMLHEPLPPKPAEPDTYFVM